MSITHDEDVLGGEPRIEGTRVGVRHVSARVIDGGQSPAHVADQLDISLADVYESLSYYYANIEELRKLEEKNEAAFERASGILTETQRNRPVTGVRILLDEHVGRVFEQLLRERGYDVEQRKTGSVNTRATPN